MARPPASAEPGEPSRDDHDEEGDRLGRVPYRPLYFAALALAIARAARAALAPPRKVLALDCDNTLWQGVVGEDGVEGIEIGRGTGRCRGSRWGRSARGCCSAS